MPPRRVRRSDRVALRDQILVEWRDLYGGTAAVLDEHIARLAAGEAIGISRYDLPDDHPLRYEGDNCDNLVLGADDAVRLREPAVNGRERGSFVPHIETRP